MKKVLIITYYWPPSGGAGVQRWLKFVKYLREFGWEPIIYTPENGDFPEIDLSLEKDVPQNITILRQPVWEPYNLYRKFIGQKDKKIGSAFVSEKAEPKLTEKISIWIRGNFFIPDARVFWIKPSIKYLSKYLSVNPVDAIISSGPPHSMHLIASELKKRHSVKWIADFRDPWTEIDFYKDLMLTSFADRKHKRLEKKVLRNADEVIVVGNTMAESFSKIYSREYQVITNGYDHDDIKKVTVEPDQKFSISHIGTLNKDRNPESLWKVLSEKVKNPDFASNLEIKLIGKVDYLVLDRLKHYGLNSYLNKIDYIPHNEVITEQQKSRVLLLLLNNTPNAKGILTGKFFEYLAVNRPILAIGPIDGDVNKILEDTKAGRMTDFDDTKNLSENIDFYYQQYINNEHNTKAGNIEKYSRKELTRSLSVLLNR